MDVAAQLVVARRHDDLVPRDDLLHAARVHGSGRRYRDAEQRDRHVFELIRLRYDLAVARQAVRDDSGSQSCSRVDDVARERLRTV